MWKSYQKEAGFLPGLLQLNRHFAALQSRGSRHLRCKNNSGAQDTDGHKRVTHQHYNNSVTLHRVAAFCFTQRYGSLKAPAYSGISIILPASS
jgi:hypothetical protein